MVGHIHHNRAIDGDTVAIEIIRYESRKEELVSPTDTPSGATVAGLMEPTAEASPSALEGLSSAEPRDGLREQGGLLYGRVVGIIRRTWRHYAGSLDPHFDASRIRSVS